MKMNKLENIRGYYAKKGNLYLSNKNTWTKDIRKAVLFGHKESAGDSIARRPTGRVVVSIDVNYVIDNRTEYENIETNI
tara:strand:- start:4046 stop:4282 length:237 start_codon:yes stop_codon:yes gene_type:complete